MIKNHEKSQRLKNHEKQLKQNVALFNQQVSGQVYEMNRLALVIDSAKNREEQLKKENFDYMNQIRTLWNHSKKLEAHLSQTDTERSRAIQANQRQAEEMGALRLRLSEMELEVHRQKICANKGSDSSQILSEELRLRTLENRDLEEKLRDTREMLNMKELVVLQQQRTADVEHEHSLQQQRQTERAMATVSQELLAKKQANRGPACGVPKTVGCSTPAAHQGGPPERKQFCFDSRTRKGAK